MSLTEWLQQFFINNFSATAEKTATPARIPDTWPHGPSWDPLNLYTYEEKEQMLKARLAQIDQQNGDTRPYRELLPVRWPDGADFDEANPYWVKETGQTYETFDEAVQAMGRAPSHNSFGILRFDP